MQSQEYPITGFLRNDFSLQISHLITAFSIYSIMFLTGMGILKSTKAVSMASTAIKESSRSMVQFKRASFGTAGLVFATAMTGGFVAGLDAGLIYNEFPMMGNSLFPSDFWYLSTESESNPNPIPAWRNVLENPSAVQFVHRVMV